jgi:hypothetical protein
MSNYTKEQLLEKYKKLPQDVQDAIFSVDTSEIIREIGEKNKLMIDKIGELADETGLVMLGLTHPNQFISNLTERLEVEHNIAKEIAEEINSKVFFPIRENLKKIHGLEKIEEAAPEGGEPRPESSGREISPAPPLPTPEPKIEIPVPPEPKPEPEITTPPVIMSMPIDLTKAQKPQTEDETFPPPDTFETKTKEEVFQPTEEIKEKKEAENPAAKKVDPYREPTL